ncbi:MAG: AglZ/HisF2 family acetamidino modification protein [Candidatus Altiarchaeota archaeon]
MMTPRVIPALLLKGTGLVKGINFKNHRYVGDPINAVRIFNTKEVDELVFLDISATQEGRTISLDVVSQIADECYMPFAVGGGINSVEQIRRLLYAGAEKVCINTAAIENPELIEKASQIFGSQSIVVSIDVKHKLFRGYDTVVRSGSKSIDRDPVDMAAEVEKLGAGEILLTSIDREGTMEGYDTEIIKQVSDVVNIPVIACGGAGKLQDLSDAITIGNASAVAAGSFFVFHGKRRAVLINFPSKEELERLFNQERVT